MLIATFIFLT